MATAKELYDAAMTIKEHCKSVPIGAPCHDCFFSKVCADWFSRSPDDWDIPKPRRFTDEEVALAKAFKSIGAVEIRGCIEGTLVISENDTCLASLPLNVFKGISTITLPIDEIIKDGE